MKSRDSRFNYVEGIPIYVEDFATYATEAYSLYTRIINNHTKQAVDLSNSTTDKESRKIAIKNIDQAIRHNLESLFEIQKILEPHVNPKILVDFHLNGGDDTSGYLKDYRYLKRDWSWDELSEKQLLSINGALKACLSPQIQSMDEDALFLGAGVGRVAFDLAHLFKRVYVTDKSFSMAYHFNQLKSKDLEFYEINYKNIYSNLDSARKVKVTMYPGHFERSYVHNIFNKLEYFISDVTRLPFPDHSISNIFSVYFSDVLALKLWLPEVKRILRPNGLFVHFGPLDYFFNDITQMLSAGEFKKVFERNGFESLQDETVDTFHLAIPNSWSSKLYTNWLYSARMVGNPKRKPEITMETLLKLADGVHYTVEGRISMGENSEYWELNFSDGMIYEGGENIVEILKIIGEGRTLRELFIEMEKQYGPITGQDRESILATLGFLLGNETIRATP